MPVPRGTTLDPSRTRTEIIDAAGRLFYARGVDGIGVAELCRLLGISKETLYRHFGSKEGLVAAVLEVRSARVTDWLAAAAASSTAAPEDQLNAVFNALAEWYAEETFRGCAILNAATQHHDGQPRNIAHTHLSKRLALFTDIAARAGAKDPDRLGRQLLMLTVGCTMVTDMRPDDECVTDARAAGLALLATARGA